jgi:hypothetical protein
MVLTVLLILTRWYMVLTVLLTGGNHAISVHILALRYLVLQRQLRGADNIPVIGRL